MKKKNILTVVFLIYLFVVFALFYHNDKRMIAVFCSIGTAIYVVLANKFSVKK